MEVRVVKSCSAICYNTLQGPTFHVFPLDATLPDIRGALPVPQRVYEPAGPVAEFVPHRPIRYYQRDGAPGIPLTAALSRNISGLTNPEEVIVTTTTSVRIAIRINVCDLLYTIALRDSRFDKWPGYGPWYKHINVYGHGNTAQHITKGKLAYEVAKEIRRFYTVGARRLLSCRKLMST